MTKKKRIRYVWTEKAEKLPNSKAKAGELATFNGHVLTNINKEVVDIWLKTGYIVETGEK